MYNMYTAVRLAALAVVAVVSTMPAAATKSQHMQVLTDSNFDHLTASGEWLVDVWAPWCPHCKDLEPTWDQLADDLQGKVNVSKIDATAEKGLLHRFASIQGFPAIFRISAQETRQYNGKRTLQQLREFALDGWKDEPALPFWQSPTSRLGYLSGRIHRIPGALQQYYRFLHEDKHYSQMSLLAGLLAIPVTMGLSLICLLDAVLTRRPLRH